MPDQTVGFFEATEMPAAQWWQALWPDPGTVLELVGIKTGMDVVDLCSGDGWFTLAIAKLARSVIGVDIDDDLIEKARARLSENRLANCTFVAGDAYELRKQVCQPVDFVFLANVFHGVPDKLRLARAACDVLKPGGCFAIINWHPRPREQTTVLGEPRGPRTELRMPADATIKAVEPAGFNLVRFVDVPPYHYGAVFERHAF
jgi:ubiquinone/menaquinone biosynthesis C-methylase UbiE